MRKSASKSQRYQNRCKTQKMIDRIDMFQKDLPTFNMRGATSVASFTGGVLSFSIFVVMMMYASFKLIHLV